MPASPPFVEYSTEQEYKIHYEQNYCQNPIQTADSIKVYFRKNLFMHAFYESSKRDGVKDLFSWERAKRIDWIKATLQNPKAELFCGWDRKKRTNDPSHRVAIVYEDYVVIIFIKKSRDGKLKGDFKTAYLADNSIRKIRTSPKWSLSLIK